MGVDGQTLPPDPIQEEPTYEGALAAFEALDPIRILFDNGAGGDPGKPNPGFEQSFASFPIPGTTARSWYFAGDGALQDEKPADAGADSFTWNPKAKPLTNFSGDTGAGEDGLWTASPAYEWEQSPDGGAVSYVTEPLGENTTVIGAGRRARVGPVVEADRRPPGHDHRGAARRQGDVRPERLGARRRCASSTAARARCSSRSSACARRDIAPMPAGRFAKVTIPLYYQGHAYRAGSRIRVTITDPNGDQPIWAFGETKPKGKVNVAIAHSQRQAVAPDPAGRARGGRPDRAAAVPRPAGRAVPGLRAVAFSAS